MFGYAFTKGGPFHVFLFSLWPWLLFLWPKESHCWMPPLNHLNLLSKTFQTFVIHYFSRTFDQLAAESGCVLEDPTATKLRSHVMDGCWERVCFIFSMISWSSYVDYTLARMLFIYLLTLNPTRISGTSSFGMVSRFIENLLHLTLLSAFCKTFWFLVSCAYGPARSSSDRHWFPQNHHLRDFAVL